MHTRRASSRPLDARSFGGLLGRLHPDPEQAGVAYEALRRNLLRFFANRGVLHAETSTDDVIDRLARRVAGEGVDDVRALALGIARLVALEMHREEARFRAPSSGFENTLADTHEAGDMDDGRRVACFDRQLARLPAGQRDLILRYYADEGRVRIRAREDLARAFGLSANALRLRAQRIRTKMETGIRQCLAHDSEGEPT